MLATINFVLLGMIGPLQILLLFVPFLISIVPLIFYLLTVQNTFKQISAENRKMEPAEVWLGIIPFFGYIWSFVIVTRLADSLKPEFAKKGIEDAEDRPGYAIGIAYCVLFAATLLPFFGIIAGFAGFVCWIVYWVKVDSYRKKLEGNWNKYDN